MKPSLPEPYQIAVLGKAFDILEALQEGDTLTLNDIAQRTMLHKATAYRVLMNLEARGYVERGSDDRRFRLTYKLVEIASRLLVRDPVRHLALPQMRLLWERFGETVNLGLLSGPEVLYVEILESRHPFRVTENPGSRSPIYSTALGKVFAAFLPKEQSQRLIEQQSFLPLTNRTITSPAQFLAALSVISHQGYAVDDEETEIGVRCVAAPILGGLGHAVAAMSISAPATRLPDDTLMEITRALTDACRAVSQLTGYTG